MKHGVVPPRARRRGETPMPNDVIANAQLPVPRPKRSVPALVFGTRPTTIAKRGSLFLVAVVGLYFGVIGNAMHSLDIDPEFTPANPVEGGSHVVNMAAGLIERETTTNRWVPSDPIFFPTAFLDNMPNFQRGLIRSVGRVAMELEDQVGRVRGSSAIDPDLQRAAGLLQYPTDVWLIDLQQSWLPVQPAEAQYNAAMRSLQDYNRRLATGNAVFDVRPDALAMMVQRIGSELGARAAVTDAHVRTASFVLNPASDDIFYFNKGAAYGYYLLLRELGRDFATVIEAQGLTAVWNQALDSLRAASQLRPVVVLSGGGDTSIFANHLHMQGFYLKRAILQLDEVSAVMNLRR
jgi:hypothetical protein